MDHPIISRDAIRQKARNAYARGVGRDGHNMNAGSPAIKDWQIEWDRCHYATLQIKAIVKPLCAEVPP